MDNAVDLERFVRAQDASGGFARACQEVRDGAKRSHWMWYVFPQIACLGHSDMSRTYAITDIEEARAYLAHPVLGARLVEITALANRHAPRGAREIFHDDDVKFHSCMTLFLLAAPQVPTFRTALDLFFDGRLDPRTEAILVAQDRERSPNSGPGERPARR